MTLQELIGKTQKRFKAARLHYGHGTENARDEAAFLVLRGLGLPFDADLGVRVFTPSRKMLESLIRKRISQRLPVAYLLKEAWLDGERFYVDRRVIVPRSHIAFMLKDLPTPRTVLDLCTGSGCLAVLAARAYPRARITASDISRDALAVARKNVAGKRRIRLVQSDLFDQIRGRFDLILTNPPYVSTPTMRKLPPEYRHEPGLALAAGSDGLDIVRRILSRAAAHLNPGGLLVCEVGDGRAAVERTFRGAGLSWPREEVFMLSRPRTSAFSGNAARRAPDRARGRSRAA